MGIPVIVIGVTRRVALATATALVGTPYTLVSILDYTESPPTYQFSAQNLGAVLFASYPRVQGLITGTAVLQEEHDKIRPVWEEYVAKVVTDETIASASPEKIKAGWVKLSDWHANNAPPPQGWEAELIKRLDAIFQSSETA